MMVSQALTWLCEEPDHSFTFNMILRRGWPGLACCGASFRVTEDEAEGLTPFCEASHVGN